MFWKKNRRRFGLRTLLLVVSMSGALSGQFGNPQPELDCRRINHELGLQWTVRGIARAIPGRAERKDVCCQRSMVTSSITKARSGMWQR